MLESITYGEAILTYEGSLKHLKKLKNLRTLKLEKTVISEVDLKKLKEDLAGVQIEQSPPDAKLLEFLRQMQGKN